MKTKIKEIPVIDEDIMREIICKKTKLSKAIVDAVLDAEYDYLLDIGIIEKNNQFKPKI